MTNLNNFQNHMLAAQLGMPAGYMDESLTQNNLNAALTAQMMSGANGAPSAMPAPNSSQAKTGVSAETRARRLANKAKAAANPSPAVSVITIGSNDEDDHVPVNRNVR